MLPSPAQPEPIVLDFPIFDYEDDDEDDDEKFARRATIWTHADAVRRSRNPQPTKDRPLSLQRRFPTGFKTTWITANSVGPLNLAAAAPERRFRLRFAPTRRVGAPRRWVGRNISSQHAKNFNCCARSENASRGRDPNAVKPLIVGRRGVREDKDNAVAGHRRQGRPVRRRQRILEFQNAGCAAGGRQR